MLGRPLQAEYPFALELGSLERRADPDGLERPCLVYLAGEIWASRMSWEHKMERSTIVEEDRGLSDDPVVNFSEPPLKLPFPEMISIALRIYP